MRAVWCRSRPRTGRSWHQRITTGCGGPEKDKVRSIITGHRPATEPGRSAADHQE
jgi:hypothetical protein